VRHKYIDGQAVEKTTKKQKWLMTERINVFLTVVKSGVMPNPRANQIEAKPAISHV
jgi:hypothetical protein